MAKVKKKPSQGPKRRFPYKIKSMTQTVLKDKTIRRTIECEMELTKFVKSQVLFEVIEYPPLKSNREIYWRVWMYEWSKKANKWLVLLGEHCTLERWKVEVTLAEYGLN